MTISDAKIQLGLPVGVSAIRKSDGTAPTVRYTPVGENMVVNGLFETDVTGWTAQSSATVTRSTATYKIGAASMSVLRSGANLSVKLTTKLTVVGGAQYHLALWAHANNTSGAYAALNWYDSTGTTISSSTTNTTTLNGWAYVVANAAAPANAASVDVELYVMTSGTAFFDAITLRPCVPVVESPYTEPSSTGTTASGPVTYEVAPSAYFLGDVRVYDMDAQTDGTLAGSSYTRVYHTRHMFVGDTLLDNGIMRVWLKKGYAAYGGIRVSAYVNGSWQTYFVVRLDTGGDTSATIRSVSLTQVGREATTVRLSDTDGNLADLTLHRGQHALKVETTRNYNVGSKQEIELNKASRFSAYNGSTVLYDDDVSAASGSVAGSSLTEPYVYSWEDADGYFVCLGMTKKPSTLLHTDASSSVVWRDTAATVAPFLRTFWVIVVPFPYLLNGYFFKEAESMTTSGGSSTADANASNALVMRLNANGETVDYTAVGYRDLPPGDYAVVWRAISNNGVSNDATITVTNTTDTTTLVSATVTITTSYAWYTNNFSVSSTDSADNIRIRLAKATATANNIDVDYALIVPRKRNSSSLAGSWWPYDVARNALMDTVARESVRKA